VRESTDPKRACRGPDVTRDQGFGASVGQQPEINRGAEYCRELPWPKVKARAGGRRPLARPDGRDTITRTAQYRQIGDERQIFVLDVEQVAVRVRDWAKPAKDAI